VPRSTHVACCPKSIPPKLEGIKVGITRLEELQRALAPFTTDASQGRFFWARWYKRALPFRWLGTNGDDPEEGDIGEWKLVNVVAISDLRGVLQRYRVCSENALINCLREMAANLPEPPAPDSPRLMFRASREALTVWGKDRFHGELIFEAGRARLEGIEGSVFVTGPPLNKDFALSEIAEVRVRHGADQSSVALTIYLKSDVGLDYVQFGASPGEMWQLIWMLYPNELPGSQRDR